MIDIFLFCVGCFLLWQGGNIVVDGSTALARRYGISELIIGLTLVAIGTSLPEVIVNIIASVKQESALVLGNVLGSNISNTCLILGATGVLSPLVIPSCRLNNEIKVYLSCLIVLLVLFFLPQSTLTWYVGLLLLGFFGFSLVMFFIPKDTSLTPAPAKNSSLFKSVCLVVLGCIFLPLGGHFLITSAINLATNLGLSKAFIALFAVALGTSLPELATSLAAAGKGNTQLALGNILGSNIFNLTLVLGISSLINPIHISSLFKQDLCLLFAMTLPLTFLLLKTKKP